MNEQKSFTHFGRRYHITEKLLQCMVSSIFVEGNSITKYLQMLNTQYAAYARDNWLNVNCAKQLDFMVIQEECNDFYHTQTIQEGLKEFILGYLHQENLRIEKEIHKTIQIDLYADAANSTLKHTIKPNIAGRRRSTADTTELHIQNWQGFLQGKFRLLPNGGETYEIFCDELASIIAHNMKTATKCVGGWENYKFHHCLNLDRGTQVDAKVLRNGLVCKIKEKLVFLKQIKHGHLEFMNMTSKNII